MPLVAVVALFGAVLGFMAVIVANVLLKRYGGLTPLAKPPDAYNVGVWGPAGAIILAVALGAYAVIHGQTWALVAAVFELFVLWIIFLVDLRAHLILNVVTYPAAVIILALSVVLPTLHWKYYVAGAVAGFLIYAILYGLGWLIMRQEALGFGDVVLATLIGLMVGFSYIGQTLLVTAVVGGLVSVGLLLLSKRERTSFIPYGVFMAVSAAAFLIYGTPPS
jgi:leader peptidase (prepilin peptidase)/N-methyltransferase